MGLCFQISNTHRHTHLALSVFLLLSSTQLRCYVEGRAILELLEAAKEGDGAVMVERAVIGSRPPSCAGRCTSCGHCEAVQVPVVPQVIRASHSHFVTSKGDYSSNYKPMNWKCKCGNVIFNP